MPRPLNESSSLSPLFFGPSLGLILVPVFGNIGKRIARRRQTVVQTKTERGVPRAAQPDKAVPRHVPDWDGTRIFLEIVRQGSFRAACEPLKMSLNALRNRFQEFEKYCGVTLATRDAYGVHPTQEGRRIYAAALKMEQAHFGVVRARDETGQAIEGRVKLAITEGLGTFWATPRLIEFQRAFPKLLVEMQCAMSPADILRSEADVGVQLVRPQNEELKIVKLGRLHSMPFAAQSYIDLYGKPSTASEYAQHRIVLQVSPQAEMESHWNDVFPNHAMDAIVAFQSNVSSAHYWATAKGAGIGVLPTYANAMGAPVVPIDIRRDDDPGKFLRWHFDIWLTYHPQGNRILRVRRLIEWVREAFSPQRHPWFGDEFIHPNDLPLSIDNLPLANLFAGFMAKERDDLEAAAAAIQTSVASSE
ncbi:MAG: LysR family transcriptional regulator [Proteobacteria bacterium]|nr:LysR family transcriptional regulator [Pseudomonadota bacterium]